MRRLKKILSILLLATIIFPLIPISEIKALAADENQIIYTYKKGTGNEKNLESIFMRLKLTINRAGSYDVLVITDDGPKTLGKLVVGEGETGTSQRNIMINNVGDNIRIKEIHIGNASITGIKPAPKITNMETYDVNKNSKLQFKGEGLNLGNIEISGEPGIFSAQSPISFEGIVEGTSGYKNISLKLPKDDVNNIVQTVNYPNAFKLLGNLSIVGDVLEMTPQSGTNDSYIYIIAKNGKFTVLNGEVKHSVFFRKNGIEPYSSDNMGEIISHSEDAKVIKVKVPKSLVDSTFYEVQVTNKVANSKGNIYEQIVERKDVSTKFFAIGSDRSPVITSINPEKGPDTGEIVTISGLRFNELGFISEFGNKEKTDKIKLKSENGVVIESGKELDNLIGDIISSEGIISNNKEDVLKLSYDIEGVDTKLIYEGKEVESIERYLAVYIGNKTTPQTIGAAPGFSFTEGLDSISVITPDSSVEKEKVVNVILIMQTEIKIAGNAEPFKIVNVVTNDNKKYTIQPSYTMPTINKVLPSQIQVVPTNENYALKEDMVIGIEGKDFKVIRTKGVTNYPAIGIGAGINNNSTNGIVVRINPGKDGEVQIHKGAEGWKTLPGSTITILNEKGDIVDGTVGKEIGNKIIISLPKSSGIRLPANVITTSKVTPKPQQIYVYNPVLGSQEYREPAKNPEVTVMFTDIGNSPSPTIDRVAPNVVAIDSGEEVIITGSNFAQGAKVFVGGTEVTGVKQELDSSGLNTLLKFNAPKFPQIVEGPTKIMVMNPDGGIAVRDFTYLKSLQRDPVLSNFTPKSGTKDTVVIIDGDNFLAPNPSGRGIYTLIGSRILMDGKDINEYNMEGTGSIKLENYVNSTKKLITENGGMAELGNYAHSIILVDKSNSNNYYNIYTDNKGNITLSDGGSGTEETNIINQYAISYGNSGFIAQKSGQTYNVTLNDDGLTLKGNGEELNLIMQTPYKFKDTDIYGSRVNVKDKNRIEFKVPGLTSKLPGGYTITVENPDTKKSTAKDLFNYYETVSVKPIINTDGIKPSIGSIEGGYQVLIEGKNFEDGSKVYIDGTLVSQKDIKREVRAGVDTIIISSMPAYKRNMNQEQTDRKPVPVVVENGDGGTAISRFTYVIPPSAKPVIDKVEFQKEKQVGSAAGEEILTITGKYFKFEEPWALTPKYKGWVKGERNKESIYYEEIDKSNDFTSYVNWRDYKEQNKVNSKKGTTKPLPTIIETYTEWLSSDVLPTVRIGGIKAQIVEFGDGYIRVVTPQIAVGKQELYVVNNDFGTSNKVVLNFEGSNVKIDNIVPNTGKKQGEDSVEITGTGFQNTRLYVMENNEKKEYNMPLVRFGTIGDTKDINNNMAGVTLEKGDFTLNYNNTDTSKAEITMTAKYNKETYTKTFEMPNYSGEPIFLPIGELKTSDDKVYPGYELVKVEAKNRKLIVEKGYSPSTNLDNSGKISLKTPSYHTVGEVQVLVINSDGGKGIGKYKYTNPASKPKIDNITRDGKDPEPGDDTKIRVLRLDYRGGQNITVLGEEFREGTTIKIGNVLSIDNKDITETLNALPNKLSFLIPGVNENLVGNLYRLTVINGDGATVSSDTVNNKWEVPIYIQFIKGESEPNLGNIVPNKGPASGGTKVIIKGKDFRDKMEGYEGKTITVFFGDVEVPANNVKIIDHSTLEVIVPPSAKIGEVPVKIENPDGTQTMGSQIFTYISRPKIKDMNPKKLFTNDKETVVTITGEQFIKGAKVIIGGKIIPTKDVKTDMVVNGSGITGVDNLGNNIESSVINGKQTATAIVENNGEIKITFAEMVDLENTSIIIINPDGGISEPYNDFKYELPLPLKPMVLEGIAGHESTVQLIWSKSDKNILNKATRYEIYGKKTSEKENTFLGDTKNAEFLIKALEPNTEYEFLVRALNEHGAAIDFATVKVKTLSLNEDKKLKEKEEKRKEHENQVKSDGKEEVQNGRLVLTLGSKVFKNSVGTLDLSLAKYKSQDKFTIAIPVELARSDNRLTIKDGTMTSIINARDLYTLGVSKLDKGDKDAYLRIHIDRTIEQHISRGKKASSKAYEQYFDYIYEKDSIKIPEILRSGQLSLIQDTIVYPNSKNTTMYIFNEETGNYTSLNTMTTDIKGRKKVILLSDR